MGTLYRGVSLEVFAKHPTGWNVPHVASEFLHDWIVALLVDPSPSGKGFTESTECLKGLITYIDIRCRRAQT